MAIFCAIRNCQSPSVLCLPACLPVVLLVYLSSGMSLHLFISLNSIKQQYKNLNRKIIITITIIAANKATASAFARQILHCLNIDSEKLLLMLLLFLLAMLLFICV